MLEEEERTKKKERISKDDVSILNNKSWHFIDNFIMPYVKSKVELTEDEQARYEDFLLDLLTDIDNLIEDEDTNLFNEEEINILHNFLYISKCVPNRFYNGLLIFLTLTGLSANTNIKTCHFFNIFKHT